eukprot:5676125-Prorocentrum_lima.AAC.1
MSRCTSCVGLWAGAAPRTYQAIEGVSDVVCFETIVPVRCCKRWPTNSMSPDERMRRPQCFRSFTFAVPASQ